MQIFVESRMRNCIEPHEEVLTESILTQKIHKTGLEKGNQNNNFLLDFKEAFNIFNYLEQKVDCVDKFQIDIKIFFKFWTAFWFLKRYFLDRHEKQTVVANNPTKDKETWRDGGVLTFSLLDIFG